MIKTERRSIFPFSAIVEQDKAKLALLCCAVDTTIGGVLLTGDKGTGKSTIVRALAYVLPEVEAVEGCPFNCNPNNSTEMCDDCYSKIQEEKSRNIVFKKMRIVDLPLTVTVDRLVGTLNIKKALTEGIRALEPGILAEANRNILYIDEVNLLDDYVADVLLDAAAMGWNIIEREGISVRHPARFILVGSMNPEEGELRPQLLDRFGLYVAIEAINDIEKRIEIIKRVDKFYKNPETFYEEYEKEEERIRRMIINARKNLKFVNIEDEILKILAKTIVKLKIKTHRAEIVTVKTAKAIAALEGRKEVTLEDLKRAIELALPHRLKSDPFDNISPQEQLEKIKEEIEKEHKKTKEKEEKNHHANAKNMEKNQETEKEDSNTGEKKEVFDSITINKKIDTKNLQIRTKETKYQAWRGSRNCRTTSIASMQGYPISYTTPKNNEQLRDIDLNGTINSAISKMKNLPLTFDETDIRVKVRKERIPKLSTIVIDSSGSMGVQKRIRIAKGLAEKLIEIAYVKKDYISIIAFRGKEAEIIAQPTRSYRQVIDILKNLATGGRTPLTSAFQTLLNLTRMFRNKNRKSIVEALLITDGKANISLSGKNMKNEIKELSRKIKKNKVKMRIFDTRSNNGIDPAPSYIELIAHHSGAEIIKT